MTEHELAREWLDHPEHDIGFEPHKHDDCGPSKSFIDSTCERCAVEVALAAYAIYRLGKQDADDRSGLCEYSAIHRDTPHFQEPGCVNWKPLD